MERVAGTAHSRGNGVNPKAKSLDPDSNHQSKSPRQNQSFSASVAELVSLRNKRSVWIIPTQPYFEEHFATFPEELVRTPILAGTSEKGCCARCGAPYRRILERQRHGDWQPNPELKQLGVNRNSKAKWSQNRSAILRTPAHRKHCCSPSCRSRARPSLSRSNHHRLEARLSVSLAGSIALRCPRSVHRQRHGRCRRQKGWLSRHRNRRLTRVFGHGDQTKPSEVLPFLLSEGSG